MKYQLRLISAMLVVLAWTWCGHSSAGTIPLTIHLDGSASGTSGNLNGDYLTRIRLFQGGDPVTGTGGTLVYEESVTLTYSSGLFSHELGEGTAPPSCGSETPCILDEDDFDTNDPLYIELAIVGETLLPWFDVSSVPFAIRSARVNTVDAAGGGTIQGDLQVDGMGTFGLGHSATGTDAFAAGFSNTVTGDWSTVGGGKENIASGWSSVVGGGFQNTASGLNGAAVGGGHENTASGGWSTVAGGWQNEASDDMSTVGGGFSNRAQGSHSTVAGGYDNWAELSHSTIGGGNTNWARGQYATVAGGNTNKATGTNATIGGGEDNSASGLKSTISGGKSNSAAGGGSTVAGGENNTALGHFATASGGLDNNVEGIYSVVGGGQENCVLANNSAILGGWADTIEATAFNSYLFGNRSKLTQPSTFMVDMPHIRFGDEASGYEFPTADGMSGEVLTTDGAGAVTWGTPPASSDGDWTISGNDLYASVTGNVGIGITSPQAKLHVVSGLGNTSVALPDDAIAAAEILDEPGITVGTELASLIEILPGGSATDLATVTIETPAPGYILVQGSCELRVTGTTNQAWSSVQVSESSGGVINGGRTVGFSAYVSDVLNYLYVGDAEVFYKPAGSHDFYLKGNVFFNLGGQIYAAHPEVIALFVPTSYGPVQAIRSEDASRRFEVAEPLLSNHNINGSDEDTKSYRVDLRELELRAARAQTEAERAKRELLEAQLQSSRDTDPDALPIQRNDR